jgi:hypothetical protein
MSGANGALVCVQRGVQRCAAGRFGLGVAVNVLCTNDKKPFKYLSSYSIMVKHIVQRCHSGTSGKNTKAHA